MTIDVFRSTVTSGYGANGTTSSLNYYSRYVQQSYETSLMEESISNEYNAKNGVIDKQLSLFAKYMEEGREDDAMAAYHKLIEEMKKQDVYQGIDDEGIKVLAEQKIIEYLSKGQDEEVDLVDYIKEHAASASERSWQKTFLNNSKIDDVTEEDLLNEICGMNEEKNVSAGQYIVEGIWNFGLFPLKLLVEECDALFGGKHH